MHVNTLRARMLLGTPFAAFLFSYILIPKIPEVKYKLSVEAIKAGLGFGSATAVILFTIYIKSIAAL